MCPGYKGKQDGSVEHLSIPQNRDVQPLAHRSIASGPWGSLWIGKFGGGEGEGQWPEPWEQLELPATWLGPASSGVAPTQPGPDLVWLGSAMILCIFQVPLHQTELQQGEWPPLELSL